MQEENDFYVFFKQKIEINETKQKKTWKRALSLGVVKSYQNCNVEIVRAWEKAIILKD